MHAEASVFSLAFSRSVVCQTSQQPRRMEQFHGELEVVVGSRVLHRTVVQGFGNLEERWEQA